MFDRCLKVTLSVVEVPPNVPVPERHRPRQAGTDADAALQSRRIDQDAAHAHLAGEAIDRAAVRVWTMVVCPLPSSSRRRLHSAMASSSPATENSDTTGASFSWPSGPLTSQLLAGTITNRTSSTRDKLQQPRAIRSPTAHQLTPHVAVSASKTPLEHSGISSGRTSVAPRAVRAATSSWTMRRPRPGCAPTNRRRHCQTSCSP